MPAGEDTETECVMRCEDVKRLVQATWPGSVIKQKDYIAAPKENGYSSLHLLLRLPSGSRLEVQIRTRCMHDHAECGAASHAKYKANAITQSAGHSCEAATHPPYDV